jgi:hypothetical protein
MADKIDFVRTFRIIQVDSQDIERAVKLVIVDLFFCLSVYDYQSNAGWWGYGASVLLCSLSLGPSYGMRDKERLTLSPKPHMRARIGCCSTIKLRNVRMRFAKRDDYAGIPVAVVSSAALKGLERGFGCLSPRLMLLRSLLSM